MQRLAPSGFRRGRLVGRLVVKSTFSSSGAWSACCAAPAQTARRNGGDSPQALPPRNQPPAHALGRDDEQRYHREGGGRQRGATATCNKIVEREFQKTNSKRQFQKTILAVCKNIEILNHGNQRVRQRSWRKNPLPRASRTPAWRWRSPWIRLLSRLKLGGLPFPRAYQSIA